MEAEQQAIKEREAANALLKQIELEARDLLAAEAQAGRAAEVKLQAERELIAMAQLRAEADMRASHAIELQVHAEAEATEQANQRYEMAECARSIAEGKAELEAGLFVRHKRKPRQMN